MAQGSFLPESLRVWRAAAPSKRAIAMRNAGSEIVLSEWIAAELYEARFRSLADAEHAIATETIRWALAKPVATARRGVFA